MNKEKKKLFLVDGHSFCYRAFYAIRELSTSSGMPTNAIYGVINMLHKLVKEYTPDMMAVVFDLKGPTVRHEKYKEYKIQRKPMPAELAAQLSGIKEVISTHNIPIYELQGFEADDIIATLARKAVGKGLDVVIVTGDKDAFQLVGDSIKVLRPQLKDNKMYDQDEVRYKYGVAPADMIELMALMGDASDNIPGVKGVGQVTARKLIEKYGTVERIYRNIDKITPAALKEKLLEGKDKASLSRELLILDTGLPVEVDEETMRLREPDHKNLARLYEKFEFQKLLREIMPKGTQPVAYSAYSSEEDIKRITGEIKKHKTIGFSIARAPDGGSIRGMAFSGEEGTAQYISFRADSGKNRKISDMLKGILEERGTAKVGYDIKESLLCLQRHGMSLENADFDVMIADYLLEPSRPDRDLADIAMRHLAYNLSFKEGGDPQGDGDGQGTLGFSDAGVYNSSCEKSDMALRLYNVLKKELEEKHLIRLFRDVEMPLVNVLARMEAEGIGIDIEYMEEIERKTREKLADAEEKIYGLAEKKFNIDSPKQLQSVLFDKLGLPPMKKTKTGFSTDESVLRKLAGMHELPAVLLEYRALKKLKTTYCDSILEMTDRETGKLHTHFNQAVTSTGRLSSSEPNLQNIPVKAPLGREIRRVFRPGDKDRSLLAADYSQIELRILAHLSEDTNLLKAFSQEEDVHKFTASLMFDRPIDRVTDRMRSMAKTVNFGIIYGMSPFGLAKDLDIGVGEAQAFISAYFQRYSGVKVFIERTIGAVREKGYVTTLLNRRRYIPEIFSPNEHERGFAERAAINTSVQGSAADLIKLAMLACHRELKDSEVRMVIQIHDELIFTVPAGEIKETAEKVKRIMEGVMDLKVPLIVDVEAGENWMDLREVAPA